MSSSNSSSISFPDVYAWFLKLPPIIQWQSDSSMSIQLTQPSLNLKITKNGTSFICFSIVVDNFNLPISLWTSKPIKLPNNLIMSVKLVNEEIMFPLLTNIIQDELKYNEKDHPRDDFVVIISNFMDTNTMAMIINVSFLTLTFLVCVYDALKDIRSECLNMLEEHLSWSYSREAMKVFVGLLGSNNLEEEWIRTMNLAITNWLSENQLQLVDMNNIRRYPSSFMFSYALSTFGLWKVQVYCPVIDMDVESSTYNYSPPDERLWFSLNYHQLECVIQLNYNVVVRDTCIDVIVNIDNIRCDVTRLINETLMRERGAGTTEKYFPSRISLQLTPTLETSSNVLSISVSKSSENPTREISVEKSIQGSFDPNSFLGLSVSAGETMSMSLKPWKFEQWVHGINSVDLNWFLHDSADGREVFSSKPSKMAMFQPKAWFRHRYSKVYRPFTRKGGVIFAQDEYGEKVCWKLKKKNININGEAMDWELNGRIWLTYWPNKHKTLYTQTKYMRFRETLKLTLPVT